MSETLTALAGVIVGAAITYLSSIQLDKKRQRKLAGKFLREAFEPELVFLANYEINNETNNPALVLESAFNKHSAAVKEFTYHISDNDAEGLKRAWEKYYQIEGWNPDDPFWAQYSKYNGDIHKAKESRQLAISRINRILRYSK